MSEEGVPFVYGRLILRDTEGEYIDHYEIRISPTPLYPNRFPHVFETANRIPVNIDWHIFESDGHCCIKDLPEEILLCKAGMDLVTFIQSEVLPYFYNQKYREVHGFFLKERSHGDWGHIEFFIDQFKTSNLQVILDGLVIVRTRRLPSRVAKCYCGSGLKYRNCHRNALQECEKFGNQELEHFGQMVIKAMLLK